MSDSSLQLVEANRQALRPAMLRHQPFLWKYAATNGATLAETATAVRKLSDPDLAEILSIAMFGLMCHTEAEMLSCSAQP